MLLGFSPLVFYVHIFDNYREKQLKKHPYGGWYFIFELATLLLLGVVSSITINISLFPDFWLERDKIPLAITITFITVIMVFLSSWIRLGGYKMPLRLTDFIPFLREIMGQSRTSHSEGKQNGKFRPTRLFIGFVFSILAGVAELLVFLYMWLLQ